MRFMRGQGHDIHWIALSYPKFEIPGIIVHHNLNLYEKNFFKRNLLAPYYLIFFKRTIRKIAPDIIHAINIKWAGWFSALNAPKNVIVTPQGSDVMLRPGLKNDLIHKYLRKYTLKKADLVTYGNNTMLRDIHFWATPKRTYKYFAGVDFNVMDFNIDTSKMKRKLGIENRKIVFSPRTFDPNSNIDLIIKTIPIVRKAFENVLYIFIRHQERKAYTAEIMALTEELDVKGNCMFLRTVEPEKMANFYSIADLIVSIVSSDGMPATLFEAMAMKTIMVLSNIPSYLELMDDEFALIINRYDKLEIADAIMKGLSHTKEVTDMVDVGYKWAWKNANIQKLNASLELIYYKMAKNN
jgi:glycosyltransferase involved in cell wall biosynthesis